MLRLKDIMAPNVFRVDANTPIREAARLMAEKRLGSVAVTRDHQIAGIVTESDMVSRVLARDLDPDSHAVHEVMSSPLITMEGDTSLDTARERMDREGIRHLLITVEGEICGIVSIRDLIHTPNPGRR
ncbi:MAG: CBS domain-containing protein [Nitrospirota bacterium]|nr:CBS domain-containing protein [Nitrospirota bacterium]